MTEPGADQLSEDVQRIVQGYTFEEPAIELGVLMENDVAVPGAVVRIPLSMLNRHGLVAGATGTGKTKTLQLMAEQISAAGVPVFAADIKGDLSGIASPGQPNDKVLARTQKIGQNWQPKACPTEFFALGGEGSGVPLRATMSSFGPVLLSKVLDLNEVQESSLGLVFHYADQAGLPLLDLKDLRAVLTHLESLDSVAGAAGNYVYFEATKKIQQEVSSGTGLTVAMTNSNVFPSMVLQMVAIGEESGALDAMLSKVADFFEQEVDEAVESLSSLMEPMIMVVLGGLIGGIVVAMYLPIFKMGQAI